MVAVRPIAPLMRIVELGTRPCDRRSASLAGNALRKLRDIVASKLILDWSPEQISG